MHISNPSYAGEAEVEVSSVLASQGYIGDFASEKQKEIQHIKSSDMQQKEC
jgi:ribosomal protein S8